MTTFSRFFNVSAQVQVLASETTVLDIINRGDGFGHTITWQVTRSSSSSADTAEVALYNLSQTDRQALVTLKPLVGAFNYRARLSIGWDGEVAELITGPLVDIQPEDRDSSPTDIISRLRFGDGLIARRNATNTSPKALDGAFWQQVIEAIIVGLPGVTGLAPSAIQALQDNQVVASRPTLAAIIGTDPVEDLNEIISSLGPGYNWGIQDSQLVIYNGGLIADNTPPRLLSPTSGALNVVEEDDGSVRVAALADPAVRPGRQVLVQKVPTDSTASILTQFASGELSLVGGGPLRVGDATYNGDTRSNSIMSVTARPFTI